MEKQSPHIAGDLPRVLNTTHATAIVVGIIIGSGIFLVPHEMMTAVGSSRMVYAVWITGGLLSLFGAMTYAEVAAMKPRVGGEYAFLRDAHGLIALPLRTWVTIAKPASIVQTIAAGLMRVLGTSAIFGFFSQPAFAHLLWSQVFAIAATWAITWLNIIGTRESANVQTLLTWLKVLMIVVIAGFCFTSFEHGSWHNFTTDFAGAKGGFPGFMIALIAALWAYDGWSDVSQMAGEGEEPATRPVAGSGRRRDRCWRALYADQRRNPVRASLRCNCSFGTPRRRRNATSRRTFRCRACFYWHGHQHICCPLSAARFRARASPSPQPATACFQTLWLASIRASKRRRQALSCKPF